ncbi:hypothetical protein [Nocardia terpenica]|uniref:Uncharacterized protein n=1 Tax=Nocardia terpenica TaxID=455432 RepID=A0A6G9ZEL0_9NOCA|nr:hypothetical protein [Nocardia terpenica]QIS23787.1 hypothetical protein F6W96_41380 [Nocardia terpenica]
MHARYAVGATLGALALLVTMPTSAHATPTTGTFYYKYGDPKNPQSHKLEDPPSTDSKDCIKFQSASFDPPKKK